MRLLSGEQASPMPKPPAGEMETFSHTALPLLPPDRARGGPSQPHNLLLFLLISEQMRLPWGIYFPSGPGPL